MKKTKFIAVILAFGVIGAIMLGCSASVSSSSSKSYTYNVETGDTIKVTINTAGGYDFIFDDGQFSVTQGDEAILTGIFTTRDDYKYYYDMFSANDDYVMAVLKRNGVNCLEYSYDGETDFICIIDDSSTGMLIGSTAKQADAEAAFNALSFSVE